MGASRSRSVIGGHEEAWMAFDWSGAPMEGGGRGMGKAAAGEETLSSMEDVKNVLGRGPGEGLNQISLSLFVVVYTNSIRQFSWELHSFLSLCLPSSEEEVRNELHLLTQRSFPGTYLAAGCACDEIIARTYRDR